MTTNKELEKIVKDLAARNEELEQRFSAMEEELDEMEEFDEPLEADNSPDSFRDAPDYGGWIIRTPNRQFNGDTCGIRFIQGMAIISKDAEGAEINVKTLTAEYGYSAQPVSEDDMNSFNKHIANNLASLMDGKSSSMESKLAGVQPVFGNVVQGG